MVIAYGKRLADSRAYGNVMVCTKSGRGLLCTFISWERVLCELNRRLQSPTLLLYDITLMFESSAEN